MLKLNDINLIRSNSYYRVDTLKALITQALLSPIKSILSSRQTEFFLKDINLLIKKGERVALLGKNGSGKSSLCRIMAAQLFSSSGSLENSFKVSLFSQIETSFYRELSGRENLNYFIKFLYSEDSAAAQSELLEKAIAFSELGHEVDRQVETYSAGMLSRLALSLILAKNHDLLILDEIHSHADLGFRQKVSERLKSVINSSNSVIVVSHYLDEVLEVCERGVVIDNGKIIFDGNIQKAVAAYRLLNGVQNA